MIVDNRPGAASDIGAAAYRAEPDGCTLLSCPTPTLSINQSLYKEWFTRKRMEACVIRDSRIA